MAPNGTEQLVNHQRKKLVAFADDTQFEPRRVSSLRETLPAVAVGGGGRGGSGVHIAAESEHDDEEDEEEDHAANVIRDSFGNLPAKQGLYNPDEERDACG
jgi:hypothetical protein